MVIYSGVKGFLDKVEISDIGKFEEALLSNLRAEKNILDNLQKKAALDDEIEKSITSLIENVVKDFINE